jgi:hypothetical protein
LLTSLVRRFCHDLFDAVELTDTVPPVTISGWVGVVIEKIIAGHLDRFATDIVAVNSQSNLTTFKAVARSLNLPADNLVLSGLPLLSGQRREVPIDNPIKTVMFADQPTVPQTRADRRSSWPIGRLNSPSGPTGAVRRHGTPLCLPRSMSRSPTATRLRTVHR